MLVTPLTHDHYWPLLQMSRKYLTQSAPCEMLLLPRRAIIDCDCFSATCRLTVTCQWQPCVFVGVVFVGIVFVGCSGHPLLLSDSRRSFCRIVGPSARQLVGLLDKSTNSDCCKCEMTITWDKCVHKWTIGCLLASVCWLLRSEVTYWLSHASLKSR